MGLARGVGSEFNLQSCPPKVGAPAHIREMGVWGVLKENMWRIRRMGLILFTPNIGKFAGRGRIFCCSKSQRKARNEVRKYLDQKEERYPRK